MGIGSFWLKNWITHVRDTARMSELCRLLLPPWAMLGSPLLAVCEPSFLMYLPLSLLETTSHLLSLALPNPRNEPFHPMGNKPHWLLHAVWCCPGKRSLGDQNLGRWANPSGKDPVERCRWQNHSCQLPWTV